MGAGEGWDPAFHAKATARNGAFTQAGDHLRTRFLVFAHPLASLLCVMSIEFKDNILVSRWDLAFVKGKKKTIVKCSSFTLAHISMQVIMLCLCRRPQPMVVQMTVSHSPGESHIFTLLFVGGAWWVTLSRRRWGKGGGVCLFLVQHHPCFWGGGAGCSLFRRIEWPPFAMQGCLVNYPVVVSQLGFFFLLQENGLLLCARPPCSHHITICISDFLARECHHITFCIVFESTETQRAHLRPFCEGAKMQPGGLVS